MRRVEVGRENFHHKPFFTFVIFLTYEYTYLFKHYIKQLQRRKKINFWTRLGWEDFSDSHILRRLCDDLNMCLSTLLVSEAIAEIRDHPLLPPIPSQPTVQSHAYTSQALKVSDEYKL